MTNCNCKYFFTNTKIYCIIPYCYTYLNKIKAPNIYKSLRVWVSVYVYSKCECVELISYLRFLMERVAKLLSFYPLFIYLIAMFLSFTIEFSTTTWTKSMDYVYTWFSIGLATDFGQNVSLADFGLLHPLIQTISCIYPW